MAAVVVLAGVSMLFFWWYQTTGQHAEIERGSEQVRKALELEIEERTDSMLLLTKTACSNERLVDALQGNNTDDLRSEGYKVFGRFSDQSHISHLHFLSPDRQLLTCLANNSAHSYRSLSRLGEHLEGPDSWAAGIDVDGQTGLLLRVISPCYRDGRCVGYVEACQDVQDIMRHVSAATGVDMLAAFDRQHLQDYRWQAVRQRLKQTGQWDTSSRRVVAYSTASVVPDNLSAYLSGRSDSVSSMRLIGRGKDSHQYAVTMLPMEELPGALKGSIAVLQDVTARLEYSNKVMGAAVLVLAVILLGIVLFFYRHFGRSQSLLMHSRNLLTDVGQAIHHWADGVLLCKHSGDVYFVNESFVNMFGKTLSSLVCHDGLASVASDVHLDEKIRMVMDTGTSWAGRTTVADTESGRDRTIEIRVEAISHGRSVGAGLVVFSDITQRVRNEEYLTDSEWRFRSAFEQSTMGMAILSPNGEIEKVNTSLCEILGYTEQELITRSILEITHEDDIEESRRQFRRVAAGKIDAYCYAKRYLHKDGRTLWVRTHNSLVRDEEGRAVHFISHVENVTEQHDTKQELSATQQRAEMALDGAKMGLYDWHIETGHVDYDIRWCGLHGFLPAQVEPTYAFWESHIHPDDRDGFVRSLADHLSGSSDYYEAQYRFRHSSGSWQWIYDRGAITQRGDDGRALRVTGTHMDITVQKDAEQSLRESERRYRILFDRNPSVMLLIDPADGSIVDANDSACSFYGYAREELSNMHIEQINTMSRDDVQQRMDTARDKDISQFSFVHRLADGQQRDVEVHSGPIELLGRRLLCSVVRDVTDRNKAILDLQNSEEKFRAIVESTTDCIVLWDREYNYLYANKAAIEHVNADPEKVIGGNMRDSLPHLPEFQQKWMSRVDEMFIRQQVMKVEDDDEINGRRVCSETILSPVRDSMGKMFAVAVVYRDMTQRTIDEESLQNTIREMESLARLAVGRELRMIELKREVNNLARAAGSDEPYDLSYVDEHGDKDMSGHALTAPGDDGLRSTAC